jgi:ATP-dependent RNA helicase RhlB
LIGKIISIIASLLKGKEDEVRRDGDADKSAAAKAPEPAAKESPGRKRRPENFKKVSTVETSGKAERKSVEDREKPAWTPADFQVPPCADKTAFHELGLPDDLLHAICDLKFEYLTPIQAEILPVALAGRDATGQAQTGTGKTAAFLIGIIANMVRNPLQGKRSKGTPRALILAPTRELALQIEEDALDLTKYIRCNVLCMIGGTGYDKQKAIIAKAPIDIAVATPGRLLDFARQKLINLGKLETLVIDEADRMLDMGFIPDISRIVRMTPPKEQRQTLFFSATLTPEVLRLASQWTRESFKAEIDPDQVAAKSVDQKVYLTTSDEKFVVLYNLVSKYELTRVLIFTNRRDQARDLTVKLCQAGIQADLLSGDLTQSKRSKALENFKAGKITALVATDVAARGIHIEGISHVVNYNLPHEAEHYVHRIGRTGRAGSTGISISFADECDSFSIPPIEKVLGNKLECEYPPDELVKKPDLSNVTPVPTTFLQSLITKRVPGRRPPGQKGKPRYNRRPDRSNKAGEEKAAAPPRKSKPRSRKPKKTNRTNVDAT